MRSAARPAHNASISPIASNIPTRRSSLGRRHQAARCARASTRPLAASCRIASRTGVRDTPKRARQFGLVQRGARRQHAAHDLVGDLQTQFLRQRAPAGIGDADFARVEAHNVHLGLRRLHQADVSGNHAPAFRKAHPGLHLASDAPGADGRSYSVEATAKSRP